VIPVLVGGAAMPRESTLPRSIRHLARRNAAGLRGAHFQADCQGLVNDIKAYLASVEGMRAASPEAERVKAEKRWGRAAEERARQQALAGRSPEEVRKAEERANWELIKTSDEPEDFRDHLVRFPQGPTADLAQKALEDVRWKALAPESDGFALIAFSKEFPESTYQGELLERIAQRRSKIDEQAKALAAELDHIEGRDADYGNDIFISYSKQEAQLTIDLAEFLRQKGYTVWWDSGLLPGVEFEKKIRAELGRSRAVIVIWTKAAIASTWVYAEAEMAKSLEKVLITVKHPDVHDKDIRMPYNTYQCTSIFDRDQILKSLLGNGVRPGFAHPNAATSATVPKATMLATALKRLGFRSN
jgi:TIR domain